MRSPSSDSDSRSRQSKSPRSSLSPIDWTKERLVEREKMPYKEPSVVKNMSSREVKRFQSKHDIELVGIDDCPVPNPVLEFEDLNINTNLMKTIKGLHWKRPTPIQSQCWPLYLTNNDVACFSRNGRVSTYLPYCIHHTQSQPKLKKGDGPIALILVPDRGIALKVNDSCKRLMLPMKLNYTAIFEGTKIRDLSNQPEILVATPSSLLQFLLARETNLKRCTCLVVDEADRMIEKGMEKDVRTVLSQLRPDKQTLFFSNTTTFSVRTLEQACCNENRFEMKIGLLALKINISAKINVQIIMKDADKYSRIKEIIRERPRQDRCIILTDTRRKAENIIEELCVRGVTASREPRKSNILVITDKDTRVSKDVNYMIFFDYPYTTEDYVNRINRTSWYKNKGLIYTLISKITHSKLLEFIDVLKHANQPIPKELSRQAGLDSEKRRATGSSSSASMSPPARRPFRSSSTSSSGSSSDGSACNDDNRPSSPIANRKVRTPPSSPEGKTNDDNSMNVDASASPVAVAVNGRARSSSSGQRVRKPPRTPPSPASSAKNGQSPHSVARSVSPAIAKARSRSPPKARRRSRSPPVAQSSRRSVVRKSSSSPMASLRRRRMSRQREKLPSPSPRQAKRRRSNSSTSDSSNKQTKRRRHRDKRKKKKHRKSNRRSRRNRSASSAN